MSGQKQDSKPAYKTDGGPLPECCCGNCVFSEPLPGFPKDYPWRTCHLMPPAVAIAKPREESGLIQRPSGGPVAGQMVYVWPEIHERSWCGSFQDREQARQRAELAHFAERST